MPEIVIVGAGVTGLYTAFVLARQGKAQDITVYARHLPGDLSIDYTSPRAGGNYSLGVISDSPLIMELSRQSWQGLERLSNEYAEDKAYLGRRRIFELWDSATAPKSLVSKVQQFIPDLEVIKDRKLLESKGADFGVCFTSFNFYGPMFIQFLKDQLESLGVRFVRRDLKSLGDAFDTETKVVFNCAGVTVDRLSDVHDSSVKPIRGSVVVVRAPHIQDNWALSEDGRPPTYLIPRPNSGGRVILGGYYQYGNASGETTGAEVASILDRTSRLCPDLLKYGQPEVIDVRAGLRPGRSGGPRIEREALNGRTVIHNYGAAGAGYQMGLGMAMKAAGLYLSSVKL